MLVEREASGKELARARIVSWEHGHRRFLETRSSGLGARNILIARGEADAPDIDGRIYIRGKAPLGEFAEVRIIGHTGYDLIAEPV